VALDCFDLANTTQSYADHYVVTLIQYPCGKNWFVDWTIWWFLCAEWWRRRQQSSYHTRGHRQIRPRSSRRVCSRICRRVSGERTQEKVSSAPSCHFVAQLWHWYIFLLSGSRLNVRC